ncbi:hypothetical protein [Halovenus salina]|uniref:Uncharacterized protein n=1 Tax=Halovenus salina TaxID=1510225 RepID=A0ABD5W0L8_9EURY
MFDQFEYLVGDDGQQDVLQKPDEAVDGEQPVPSATIPIRGSRSRRHASALRMPSPDAKTKTPRLTYCSSSCASSSGSGIIVVGLIGEANGS